MVSDFFYPNMGGVETHIFNLSQCLLARGHKVVVVTHAYAAGKRVCVRWLARGLKVYYLPVPVMFSGCSWTTIIANISLFRSVYIRERIDLVHGHQSTGKRPGRCGTAEAQHTVLTRQAFSNLAHEGILHARSMGLPCTFTDHSLFGFADASSILTNKLLKFTLSDVESVICVSNTSKENTVLRASLDPERVHVIPNAIISAHFTPEHSRRDPRHVTIVVLSRLVYRKGIDLLVALVPRICALYPGVRFLIAGDGPKKVDLEQMRDEHLLHGRVSIIGAVPSDEVRNVLVQGHIFLNTSLTEAFCIAIVEAASCGLLVVTTRVGGVPEVLPSDMLLMASPDEDALAEALGTAIHTIGGPQCDGYIRPDAEGAGPARSAVADPATFHKRVAEMYCWADVAERTERVYMSAGAGDASLFQRLVQYYGCGEMFGKICCVILVVDYVLLLVLNVLQPVADIDIAPDFDRASYDEEIERMRSSHTH